MIPDCRTPIVSISAALAQSSRSKVGLLRPVVLPRVHEPCCNPCRHNVWSDCIPYRTVRASSRLPPMRRNRTGSIRNRLKNLRNLVETPWEAMGHPPSTPTLTKALVDKPPVAPVRSHERESEFVPWDHYIIRLMTRCDCSRLTPSGRWARGPSASRIGSSRPRDFRSLFCRKRPV